MNSIDLDALKRACPMPVLLHRMGLGEFAKNSCCSPFREDKRPSWGIFRRGGKWFWKDHGNGDGGDEITLLARWKGLDADQDFQGLLMLYAELAGQPKVDFPGASVNGSGPEKSQLFSWSSCASAITPADLEQLAQWRGYSAEFCLWIGREKLVGKYQGHWAFPVHGQHGEVLGAHCRVESGRGGKAGWFYFPKGLQTRPLIFGDTGQAAHALVFESQWDAFAVMDKLGWHKPKGIPSTCILITRGAANGAVVAGFFGPEKVVYAFKQNDETKNGANPANNWLERICVNAGCSVLEVTTPEQFKDVNDWIKAGATGADIMASITDAKPVPSDSARVESVGGEATCDHRLSSLQSWPAPLESAALHGVAGELVKRLDPHTEADPAAILFQFLVGFGNRIGRTAHFKVEAHQHFCNINTVLVGETSKARKGVSWGRVVALLRAIDPAWKPPAGGLSTGEGLIWAVRDPTANGDEADDPGTADKRLLLVEEEFARVLKCANREHSTLSAVFRQAFDTGNLRILTKTNPAEVTEAHISLIGHITRQELVRHLADTECANGFANRILWICVRRSKELPDGGNAHLLDLADIKARLRQAAAFADTHGELMRDDAARELWHIVYHELSRGRPGLLGAVTSRAEAIVVRLSVIYAVLDCSNLVRREHLEAALAAWRYSEDSSRYIFGESLGDRRADAILTALRAAGAAGLARTQISNRVFGGNCPAFELDRALNHLAEVGLAVSKVNLTAGRSATMWFAK